MSDAAALPSVQHEYPDLPKLDAVTLYKRRETVFLVFSGLFLGTLAMLNILGITRFIKLYDTGLTVAGVPLVCAVAIGVLPYPITFLCTDFISELYGRARANRVVWVGLLLNVWVVAILWIGGALPGFAEHDPVTGFPPRPEWSDDKKAFVETGWTFFQVRSLAFGAVAASMIAYLTAQFIDVHVFHLWRNFSKGKHLWLRNNGSTLVSQFVDTVSVILITHFVAHALPVDQERALWPQLLVFIASGYAFKAVAALLDTIPFYIGARHLTRYLRLPPPDHWPAPPAAAAVEAGVG